MGQSKTGFRCLECGCIAGSVTLLDDLHLELDGFLGTVRQVISIQSRDRLIEALAMEEADACRALYALDALWAPWYCPECDATYCRQHWVIQLTFEDDEGFPGWYDCAHGTCPRGHRRLIDD